jgi:acyl-CoA thioester hydrolase
LVTPTPFTHTSAVRFGDTDMMGHVNNAKFATYLESARVAFFASAAEDRVGQSGLILARSEIDFVAPIHFGAGDVVTSVWVEKVGTRSFRLGHHMEQAGRVVGEAAVVLVAYDYAAGASRPLTGDERAALAAHQRA